MRVRGWAGWMIASMLLVRVANADEPAATPTPAPSAQLSSRDATIAAQPFVRDHKLAFSFGTRVLCLDVTAASFCMGGLQLGFDFKYGDVHAGVIGNVLSSPADGSLAPYGGIELGTRYYFVAERRAARPVALGIALRGDLDFLGVYSFFRASAEYSAFAVANTYGANAQLLIGSRFGLTARAGVGWSERIVSPPGSTGSTSTAGFAVDLALSALARF